MILKHEIRHFHVDERLVELGHRTSTERLVNTFGTFSDEDIIIRFNSDESSTTGYLRRTSS